MKCKHINCNKSLVFIVIVEIQLYKSENLVYQINIIALLPCIRYSSPTHNSSLKALLIISQAMRLSQRTCMALSVVLIKLSDIIEHMFGNAMNFPPYARIFEQTIAGAVLKLNIQFDDIGVRDSIFGRCISSPALALEQQ